MDGGIRFRIPLTPEAGLPMHDIIEMAAVLAGATYGVLLARRHHMDFVGVFSLAFIVAFGGGTVRDLLLDRHPLFWLREQHYPMVVFGLALLTSLIPRIVERLERYLCIPDAMGLGLFSIVGAEAALESNASYFNSAVLGAVTGTFGGVIGDVICNQVPSLFRMAPLFATCSFTGCWLYFLMRVWPATAPAAAPMAITFIVVFRLAAIRYRWQLPNLGPGPEPTAE